MAYFSALNTIKMRRVRLLMLVLGIFIGVFLIAAFAYYAWLDRTRTLNDAGARLEALSVAVAANTESTFRTAASVLRSIEIEIQNTGGVQHIDEKKLYDIFQRHLTVFPTVDSFPLHALWAVNADGAVIANSVEYPGKAVMADDREYFLYHKENKKGDAYISPLSISRVSGEAVIFQTIRLEDKAGKFAGTLGISLRVKYFNQLYQRLNLIPDSSITLVRNDGKLLFRYPFEEGYSKIDVGKSKAFQQMWEQGHGNRLASRSPYDTRARIMGFSLGDQFPLMAVVTEPEDLVLTQWQHNAVIFGMFGLTAYLIIALLFIYSLRQLRQLESVTELSTHDALTGLPNRRYFDQQLPIEWQRTIRARQAFSILFIDIDHFKRYNDYYGHDHGDRCLQLVGERLEGELKRAGDVIVRYGGEEFVCLLPNTDTAGSAKLAQNLIDAITRTAIPHADSPVAPIISVSIGVASTNPQSGDNVIELMRRADEMLYSAKEQGRNRIAQATLESPKDVSVNPD